MKQNISKFTGGLVLVVVLAMAQAASAFYDANLGRWMNRDPLNEHGFEHARNLSSSTFRTFLETQQPDGNLFSFLANSTPNSVDPLGLTFWSKGDCSALIRQMADLYETITADPEAWNVEDLKRELDDKEGLYNRFCKDPPEPPEPPGVPVIVPPYPFGNNCVYSPYPRRPFGGGLFVNPGLVIGTRYAVIGGTFAIGAGAYVIATRGRGIK